VATERSLGRAHIEYDWAEAVRQDYRARMRASTAGFQHSLDFDLVLRGRQFILTVWETDLERREEKLVEEQEGGLYSFNGRDLSVELEELRERMARVENEHAVEGVQLSWSVMEIFDALVDKGMFPIQDIPV
jgi:hypothetical protein